MKAMRKNKEAKRNPGKEVLKGPSYYEVIYLRQLKDELEIFLRSKNFSTIHEIDIAFAGDDYTGHMKVGA